eukprot:snap_masked-scaffold_7-processed-gene-0.8-mRNA-1 protein AED:1.00 eAED:1.00 QI:0/0/0/0/1/1/2/0/61
MKAVSTHMSYLRMRGKKFGSTGGAKAANKIKTRNPRARDMYLALCYSIISTLTTTFSWSYV